MGKRYERGAWERGSNGIIPYLQEHMEKIKPDRDFELFLL